MWLDASEDALRSHRDDDVCWKARFVFINEIVLSKDTGLCSHNLYAWLLVFRAELSEQTEDLEGCNSILQVMTSRGPRVKLPSADARMTTRFGQSVDAHECSSRHNDIQAFMETPQSVSKFSLVPVGDGPDLPRVVPPAPLNATSILAASLALSLYRQALSRLATHVTIFAPKQTDASNFAEGHHSGFVFSWSHYSTMFAHPGTIDNGRFMVARPLVSSVVTAVAIISGLPCYQSMYDEFIAQREAGKSSGKKTHQLQKLNIFQAPIRWLGLGYGVIDCLGGTWVELKRSIPQQKRKTTNGTSPASADHVPLPAPDIADIDENQSDGGDEHEEPCDLEADLLRVMEASCYTADDEGELQFAGVDSTHTGSIEEPIEFEDDSTVPPLPSDVADEGSDDDDKIAEVSIAMPSVASDIVVAARTAISKLSADMRDIIQKAHERAAAQGGTDIKKNDVSLVVCAGFVSFINWTDMENRMARPVTYSLPNLTVKAIVPFKVPPVNMSDARVVVRQCDFVVARSKATEGADKVSSWCYWLEQWENAQLFSGPHAPDNRMQCILCATCKKIGELPKFEGDLYSYGGVFRCCVCLSFWHHGCSDLASLKWSGKRDAVVVQPLAFKCVVCEKDA